MKQIRLEELTAEMWEPIQEIAEIEQQIFSDAWNRNSLMQTMQQTHTYAICAVEDKIAGGKLQGYLIVYQSFEESDIARIAVSLDARRLGIADTLLDAYWGHCKTHGITRVLLEVRSSNEAAISLYKKHGFIQLGKRRNYYAKPLEDGIVMEKELGITTSKVGL